MDRATIESDNSARRVVLYTRHECHICDDARQVLEAHGIAELFDTCVPVVEIDGKIRFRGRVEPVLLRRILATTS